jgi:ubiquinone/menaquinone biosynthesis C-methylase UbiE
MATQRYQLEITAVDFSENLVAGAKELSQQMRAELKRQPAFVCADAIDYISKCADNSFNYILTERFLQNMPTKSVQYELIREIHRVLAPGGCLLMCEGSDVGFEGLNDLRESVGLSRIPATSADNITAIRFNDEELESYARELGYTVREKLGYSSYFMITRVLHPLLVRPQAPRFDAPINELARTIQQHAPLKPGYGGNTLWVLEKRS